MTDWECSVLIGALKHYAKHGRSIRTNKPFPKATITFVEKHLQKGISEALGIVLKAEFKDLGIYATNGGFIRKQGIDYEKLAKEIIKISELPVTKENMNRQHYIWRDLTVAKNSI